MSALDPVLGNALLDVLLPNGASGTLTVGAATYTLPFNMRFMGTRGTPGSNGTAITGTSSVAMNGQFTAGAASVSNVPTKANTGALTITASASGTWNGIEVWDSTGTPKRVVFGPTSDLGKAFATSDILSVPIGSLSGTAT